MDGYKIQGMFQGIFRIPFLNGQQASYLLDNEVASCPWRSMSTRWASRRHASN